MLILYTGVFILINYYIPCNIQHLQITSSKICGIGNHDEGYDWLLERQLGSPMPDASYDRSISSHGFGEVESATGLASAASSGFAHCRPLPSSAEPLHEIHNGSHRYNFAKIAYGSEAAASTCRAIGQKVITFMIVPFVMTLLALGVNINYICRKCITQLRSFLRYIYLIICQYVNDFMTESSSFTHRLLVKFAFTYNTNCITYVRL